MNGGLSQNARVMDAVLKPLRNHWMAEEQALLAEIDDHKAQIERTRERLDNIELTPREGAIDLAKCTAVFVAFVGCLVAAAIMFGG